MTPRPYQQAAHDAVFKEWEERRSTLLEMATGTGKTIVFSMILKTLAQQGKRGLVLAHRDELIEVSGGELTSRRPCRLPLLGAGESVPDSWNGDNNWNGCDAIWCAHRPWIRIW
jgi:hypothetical protein